MENLENEIKKIIIEVANLEGMTVDISLFQKR